MDNLYSILKLERTDANENKRRGKTAFTKSNMFESDVQVIYKELLDALKANEDFEKSLCCKRKFSECIPDNVKRNICFTKDEPIFYNMFLTLEEIYTGCCKTAKIRRNVIDFPGSNQCAKDKSLEIIVKSGTPPGTQFRFVNLGDVHYNRIPADIVFTLKEKPHDRFTLVNADLHYVASIDLKTAITGGTIAIKSIDGETLRIKLTDVIEPKSVMVIPNHGMTKYGDVNKRGDLVIRFNVIFPMAVDSRSRMIISEALDDDSD